MEQARIVVIGGGMSGVCCLYQLARMGETDTLLVEREELTAGSSWHAAGHVTAFSGSWGNMRAQAYARGFYEELARTVDDPFSFHIDGCLYPAHSAERMDHLNYVAGIARAQGLDMTIVSPAEMEALHPFLEAGDSVGGLFDAAEGVIDPAQVVHAVAAGARRLGARVMRHNPVEAIERDGDDWVVRGATGSVRCEIVINAAGFRGAEVGAMMGQDLPIANLAHQYVVTDAVPEVAALDGRFPIVRDPDGEFYARRERDGLLLGSYGHDANIVWRDGVPADFGQELFPDDLAQLEAIYEDAVTMMPLIAEAGIQRCVNGPIPYAPDAQPLAGPAPGLRNAYHACAVQIGFCQGPAVGKAIAELITGGETEWDNWAWDPRRFGAWATADFAAARVAELYENQYAPPWPHRVWQSARPVSRSPLHDTMAERGAVFAQMGGWERALWFRTGDVPDDGHPSFRHEGWMPAVAQECLAVRDRVGVMDHSGFTRYHVSGEGAAAWLDGLICGRLPAVGRVGLRYLLTPGGMIETEATVTRWSENDFVLLGPTLAATRDFDIFQRLLPTTGSVSLADESGSRATLMVMGPRSRALLSCLTSDDLSREAAPWMSARHITLAGVAVEALRVSFVGELGWELHVAPGDAAVLLNALRAEGAAFGLGDFGSYALNAMRIEKGYHGWQAEFGVEYTPFDAGIDRFIAFDKPAFRGRDAVLAARDKPADWSFVMLDVAPGDSDPHANSPILADGKPVGFVTSGSHGYRTGKCIALGFVEAAAGKRDRFDVLVLGDERSATRLERSVYDPDNRRPKA
ncbi:MAG: FAD-dependent oxidoreductase [Rhodospirillales bacterium]|nr:FAD-dependent oxidoreductase [Rhodospirillales bacterium]